MKLLPGLLLVVCAPVLAAETDLSAHTMLSEASKSGVIRTVSPEAKPAPAPEAKPSPMPEAKPAPTHQPKPKPAVQTGSVARAVFTTGVESREPTDSVLTLSNADGKIYFFTDLRGLQGQHVVHRWIYDGTVMGDVGFDVKGPRWRVWSSKSLQPDWLGQWTVEVLNGAGKVISQSSFQYTQAEATR